MLDLFNPIVEQDKLHKKFNFLLDLGYEYEKKILCNWWKEFVIKDGENKTIKEFQTTFHSVFWEMYLNKVFLDSGCTINKEIKSPDFFINFNEHKISIEAVVANIEKNGKAENERTEQDAFGENDINDIIDESIVRIFNAIDSKSKLYLNKYKDIEEVGSNPFVVAVSDYGQINYGQSYIYGMLAVLYSAYYDPKDITSLKILGNDNFNREYKYKREYCKKNGGILNLGLFQDTSFSHISAIIYSSTLSLGKLTSISPQHSFNFSRRCIFVERDLPSLDSNEFSFMKIRYSGSTPDELLSDGLFVFHNPFADKPLDKGFLDQRGITHIRFDKETCDPLIIEYDERSPPLKRRKVTYEGLEERHIDNFEDFIWIPS